MHLFLLYLTLAVGSAYAQEPCGCPYQIKQCEGCDSSKLFVALNGTNTCTLACESGYEIESPEVSFLGCSVHSPEFRGYTRHSGYSPNAGLLVAGENPSVTCKPVAIRKCEPQYMWTTFECPSCDASQIIVSPGEKNRCAIQCKKGYRLVAKDNAGVLYDDIFEGTGNIQGDWRLIYPDGLLNSGYPKPPPGFKFNCQPVNGQVVPPTLPPSPCGNCAFSADSSTMQSECTSHNNWRLSCGQGLIASGENTFDNLLCVNEEWYGTTCEGKVGILGASVSASCPLTCSSTCASEGAPSLEEAPIVTCLDGKEMRTCEEGDLIIDTDSGPVSYAKAVCMGGGKWVAFNCDGTAKYFTGAIKGRCSLPTPPTTPAAPTTTMGPGCQVFPANITKCEAVVAGGGSYSCNYPLYATSTRLKCADWGDSFIVTDDWAHKFYKEAKCVDGVWIMRALEYGVSGWLDPEPMPAFVNAVTCTNAISSNVG